MVMGSKLKIIYMKQNFVKITKTGVVLSLKDQFLISPKLFGNNLARFYHLINTPWPKK